MRKAALLLVLSLACAVPAIAGPFTPTASPAKDGSRAVVDLPISQHMRNTGGIDGLGLCVFTSIEHAARWQNIVNLDGYRRWMERRQGGGYPSKVDSTLAAFCREKGVPVPEYVQHRGGDDSFLDMAIETGRCPSITYAGSDDFYRGGIDHMVNLAHLDKEKAAIIDNNRPGVWLWMSRADLLSRWRARGGGWAVVFLDPPPTVYGTAPAAEFVAGDVICICGDECKCKKGNCPGKCPLVYGQCANGRCQAPAFRQPVNALTWPDARRRAIETRGRGVVFVGIEVDPSEPNAVYIPAGGEWEVGAWDYWSDGSTCWAQRREVVNVPGPGVVEFAAKAADPPTGVIPDRVHDAPRYSISGQPCSKADAADALTDDRSRWHLAAVGDADFLSRVRADVAALGEVRAKLHVQYYRPDAWQVSQLGLSPGVALRKPSSGRVSSDVGAVSTGDYSAAKLSDLLSASGGPLFKPKPPATPEVPDVIPVLPKPNIPIQWWLIGGAILLVYLKRKEPK